jgi:hypothetical protein
MLISNRDHTMKKTKKRCVHCHQLFHIKRNSNQNYCTEQTCQSSRKHSWRKRKHIDDPDYRANRQLSNKKWQQSNADYWRKYRATHQEYLKRNRQQQQKRDQRRVKSEHKSDTPHLAKSDAFIAENDIKSGVYEIIPVVDSTLAKSDALIVKISLMSCS